MSFVLVTPEALSAAAADTARIGSAINAATTAAAAQTTSVVAAAGDEVSAAVATLFGTYGQTYQALAAQASGLHQHFENALAAAGSSYAGAEAASAAPLQQTQAAFSAVEQNVLSAVNAPSLALTGRPLIGNGATADRARPA
ncbi:PE family protein, partial [Mycobacterium ulcerans]